MKVPPTGRGAPRASRVSRLLVLWALASALAVTFALSWLPASFDGHDYLPLGADSFYHARRILDTVADPRAFYEFDTHIHAPQGSLLTWPWAYDRLIAALVSALAAAFPGVSPQTLLAHVPVALAPVNVALVIALGVVVELPGWALALLAATYASSPLTRELHAVGMIDHHDVEHLFFLAALITGMRWLQEPTRARALACGVVLGLAPAFHNGLFVLQAFVLAGLGVLWLRRLLDLRGTQCAFAAGLLGATVLALGPSLAFHSFHWEFYYLGWFHLAVAVGSASTVIAFARFPPTRRALCCAALALAIAGLCAARQIVAGGAFVFADMPALRDVEEAQSLFQLVHAGAWPLLLQRYGGMVVLLPPLLGMMIWRLFRERRPDHVLLAAVLLCGGFLLMQQLRLHYFGSLLLLLAPLEIACAWLSRQAQHRLALGAAGGILLLALHLPAAATFGSYPALGGDRNYAINRAIIKKLGEYCKAAPGVVLAHYGDGHYLRFHTDCSVIANNMIMTPQHLERIALTEALFQLSPADVRARYPWIDYLYLWRRDNLLAMTSPAEIEALNPPLFRSLLTNPALPPGYELLGEVALRTPGQPRVIVARIVRIVHTRGRADP